MFSHTQARQRVDTVNVHCAATANAFSAASPESKSRVDLVLDPDKRVEHHGSGLVQVEGVGLHLRLAGGLVGVPSVDLEGLLEGVLVERRLLDVGGLRGRDRRARGGHGFGGGGNGLALAVLDGGGHATAEDLRRKAPGCQTKSHGARREMKGGGVESGSGVGSGLWGFEGAGGELVNVWRESEIYDGAARRQIVLFPIQPISGSLSVILGKRDSKSV